MGYIKVSCNKIHKKPFAASLLVFNHYHNHSYSSAIINVTYVHNYGDGVGSGVVSCMAYNLKMHDLNLTQYRLHLIK